MCNPLSPQTTFNPQVNSVPVYGQDVQQGGSPQTGLWGSFGSVAYQPNTQNQMQYHSFPGQGAGDRPVSEWAPRPVERQIELASQATSERNQILRDSFDSQRQLFGAYDAVRGQIGSLEQENTKLQQDNTKLRDELSQRAPFSQEALSPFFQRTHTLSAQMGDYAQLVGDNASQLQLLGEIKTAGEQATVKLRENDAQIANLTSDKQTLQVALEQLQTTLTGVQQNLTTENELNHQLRLEVAAHREALTQTQVEVNTAQANVGRLEALLARSTDSLTQSQEEVNSLRSELTRLAHECTEKDNQIQKMEDSITGLKGRGDNYKTQVEEGKQLVTKMLEERKALQGELAQVRGDLQEAKANADCAELQHQQNAEGLVRELGTARAQLQEAVQAHTMNVQQIKQNHQELVTRLQTQIQTQSDLLTQARTEKSELEGQLQGGIGREEAEALRQELAEMDTTIQRLDGEISCLKDDLDSKETDHEQVLRDLRSSHGEEVHHLARDLQSARDELELKERDMRADAETMGQQTTLIARLQNENHQILAHSEQTSLQLRELQQQMESLRVQTSMNTKKIEDFGTKLFSCISQLEQASQHSQLLTNVLEDLRGLNTEFNGEGGLKHSTEGALSALNSLQSQVSDLQQKVSNSTVTEGEHVHSHSIQRVIMTRDGAGSLDMSEAPRHFSSGGAQGLDDMVRNLDTSDSSSDQDLGIGQQRSSNLSLEIQNLLMRNTSPTV